jgi:Exopolysaccharide biosynthesis protein YbjH
MRIAFVLIIVLFSHCLGYGQNAYGVSGLIKTPSAYTIGDGETCVAIQLFDDYYKSFDKKKNRFWTQSINIGFLSWLEMGIRLVHYPDLKSKGHDRNINLKIVARKEQGYWPQFALGIQDAIGTRRYHNAYLVISKKIIKGKKAGLSASLGYGSKVWDEMMGEKASDYWQQGLFINAEVDYSGFISAMMEVHSEGWDAGFKIQPFKWLFVKAFSNAKNYNGGIVGIQFTL